MASRRMFSMDIVDSDAFLDMPTSARLLYYDLGMRADDDGFVDNPKKIVRMTGASQDDLMILFTKKFLLSFDSGILVIKHWKINNQIRADRYKPTNYQDEKNTLFIGQNKAYTTENKLGIPNGNQMATQYSIGKVRLGKDSIGEMATISSLKNECFEKLFSYYPKQTKKEGARKEFERKVYNKNEKQIKLISNKISKMIKSNIIENEEFDIAYCQDFKNWLADNIPNAIIEE